MTERTRFEILDAVIGQTLRSVSSLVFDILDEDTVASRQGISLYLDSTVITLRALNDTSEIVVSDCELAIPNDPKFQNCYSITDISHDEFLYPFLGKRVRNWWRIINDAGYDDGFMIAFSVTDGLCFVVMNDAISILNVSGEQWS